MCHSFHNGPSPLLWLRGLENTTPYEHTINSKLPFERDDEQKARRKDMFSQFDPNGNGILSLAEIDKAMRDVLQCDTLFDAKPAIMRAFQSAKTVSKKALTHQGKDLSDDYISFPEFRFFLKALRMYFEYMIAFQRADADSDKRINLAEFEAAKDTVNKWLKDEHKIHDMAAEFKKIDKNGGGIILFDEFCEWAIAKNLDLDDDVEA